MNKTIFILAVFATICSCKKAESPSGTDNTCKVSNTTIPGVYTKTAIKYKVSASAPEQDLFTDLQPCEKDDTYDLKNDGSVVVGSGAEVCPGPPPPGSVTAWSLSDDNKTLMLDAVLTINSFDCTTLVVTENNFFTPGDSKTTTYVKK